MDMAQLVEWLQSPKFINSITKQKNIYTKNQ